MAGCYSKSNTSQFNVYLMGHSGDDWATDRVSRKNVCVKQPALTCAYAIQPAVIQSLAKIPAFRGRGLLARFLYAFPRSLIGQRQAASESVPKAVKNAYYQTVRTLADVNTERRILKLTANASIALESWEAEIETMLADGGRMEMFRDWGSKLAGATLRIAAVLHCVKEVMARSRDVRHRTPRKISVETIRSAIEIARYAIPHTEAALNLMQAQDNGHDADAQYVLGWIRRNGQREFTKRDIQQNCKRRFRRAADIDPLLDELTRRGYIRPLASESKGPGRPSQGYEVNPAFEF